jgi:glucosylceramidase
VRALFVATVFGLLAACRPHEPKILVDPPLERARIWVTTADGAELLNEQPSTLLFARTPDSAPMVIHVNPATRYQQIIGWGGAMTDAAASLIQKAMTPQARAALLSDLFSREKGIGFTFIRVPMGASDFSSRHYSYDDVPAGQTDPALTRFSIDVDKADKLPLLRQAMAINPAILVVGSPWSAPAWMKTTASLVKGTLREQYYDSFALYFVKFIEAYAREGVRVNAVTMQNEPNFEPENYPGMRLEAAQRAKVIGEHVGPAFRRAGLSTQIWDWDHNWDVPESPLTVLADSAARQFVQAVAWHCYGGDVSAQGKVRDAHPEKDVYFTECSGGEWAPKFADNLKWTVANLVIGTTRNWARAVAMWNLALDENHGPHLGGCDNCRGVVTINSKTGAVTRNVEYYAFAHASKFVSPGAYRIASSEPSSELRNVAFRNPDSSLVLIVLNSSAKTQPITVRDEVASFSYSIPAEAVATFVWR